MGQEYDAELLLRVFSHHRDLYAAWQRELRERLRARFEGVLTFRAAEGGCGEGLSTQVAVEALEGIELVAVDNEPLMLAQARERLGGERRVQFREGDILAYLKSQPDDSIHAFVTSFLLHNMEPERRPEVVREAYRVLMPGGVFLNADRCGRDNLVEYFVDLSTQMQAMSAFLALGEPEQYVHWMKHILRDENWRFQEAEQRQILEDAGFVGVEMIGRWQTECLFGAYKPC